MGGGGSGDGVVAHRVESIPAGKVVSVDRRGGEVEGVTGARMVAGSSGRGSVKGPNMARGRVNSLFKTLHNH
jgi:hypothetical protein